DERAVAIEQDTGCFGHETRARTARTCAGAADRFSTPPPRPAQPQRRRTRPQNRSLKLGSPPEVRDSPWRPRRQWPEREPAARRRTDRQAHLAYDLGVQHRPERVEVSGVCFHQIAAFARVRDEIIKLVSVVLHVVDELVPAIDQHPTPWLEGWPFRPRVHPADEGSPP